MRSRRFEQTRVTLIAAVLLGICGASACEGHDFWIQPGEYWLRPDTVIPVTLQVGHGPFRQRSPIQLNRIVRFTAIAPDGNPIELRERLHLGAATQDGNLRLRAPGAYVLVLETDDRAQSHLPAIRFNDYLKAEGLTAALAQRERTHRMDADGSENYSRRAKSILQVGLPGAGSQAQVTRPLGLPLEIVPLVSPYTQPRPANLPVRVIYEGRPLAGALLKLTNLAQDAPPLDAHLPDSAGRATFIMPDCGAWLLNVIWTK